MKEKIEDLVDNHKLIRLELNNFIEELNKIDISKLSKQEYNDLTESKLRYSQEISLRAGFINELQSLL